MATHYLFTTLHYLFTSWKMSITITILKTRRGNDRGIILLSLIIKTVIIILESMLEEKYEIKEEEQGLQKNRSTIGATYIMRQQRMKRNSINHCTRAISI